MRKGAVDSESFCKNYIDFSILYLSLI